MAAPEGTVVTGATGRTRLGRTEHLPRRRPALWRDIERLYSGVVGLEGRLILQAGGALRATRRRPFPASKAIPRWQPQSSDSRGKGCTHMLQEAGLIQLIQCVISYDKSPKHIIRCHTACQQDLAFRPSLTKHEGQRRKHQYYRRHVGIRLRLTLIAGPDHAA
jgi:hypothetical protein